MTELAPVLTNCHTCRHPLVELINRRMTKEGWSDQKISAWLREEGDAYYISRISLGKHRREHLMEEHEKLRAEAAAKLEAQKKTRKGPRPADLATLVRDTVIDAVADGELVPTIAEGLRAQEMLDRRAEKGEDRNLILQVAQILSGAAPIGLLEDGTTVEGTFVEVTAEEAEDEALFARLTAGPE